MNEKNTKKINLKAVVVSILIFLLGAVAYGAARFILIDKNETHYHANFALYVNGIKDDFNSFVFYEEVSACTSDHKMNPKSRTHMHNNINNLIHVHDEAVTWGHFFSNVGYILSDNVLITPKGSYTTNSEEKLTFILNGNKINSVSNKVINSEDTLLINYGNEKDNKISERYNGINKSAKEYNEKADPNTCSGGTETFKQRFIRTLFN